MELYLLFLIQFLMFASGLETDDKLDHYLIACRTTDFECFKKQYVSLRDNVLLGSTRVGIEEYTPFYVQYGSSGTCLKVTGLEESILTGISMQSQTHSLTMLLEMPVRISQVTILDNTLCATPNHPYDNVGPHTGELKKFAGNATFKAMYPYELKKKKDLIYLHLEEEDLDVTVDIPDLREYLDGDQEERKEYEMAEWAYDVVQNIDVANDLVHPYMGKMRIVADKVPLKKLILLYPHEEYADIEFTYGESDFY